MDEENEGVPYNGLLTKEEHLRLIALTQARLVRNSSSEREVIVQCAQLFYSYIKGDTK